MTENQWDGILASTAEDVLETMFFTGIEGLADADAPPSGPHLGVRLAFAGTPSGMLTLRISEASARSLASNFLAAEADEPLPDAPLGAVVGELANMICGALLSQVQSETHFHLSSPELMPSGAVQPDCRPTQSLNLGDGTLDLWLEVEKHAG
jgi:CheY-specific phosphatase CheX